jgi:hypothetical protein
MKLTIYDDTPNCNELCQTSIAHVSVFNSKEVTMHFSVQDNQLEVMKILLQKATTFKVSGHNQLTFYPDQLGSVRFRFD